jgi:hypothetical protein
MVLVLSKFDVLKKKNCQQLRHPNVSKNLLNVLYTIISIWDNLTKFNS